VSVRFKPLERDQTYLLPPSLQEWLPPGDLAYFVIDVVDQLDLSALVRYDEVREDGTSKAAGGQPPFHPKLMTALVLYAYALGTPSSRQIARLCERDAGYRIVAANQQPDFRTISEFRRIHLKALSALFVQVLQVAREAGLVKLGHVALDGTKVKANASKHKAMSYARMVEREAAYTEQVEALLTRAEQTDAAEDERYGPDRRGDELPKELQFRQRRLERLREAKRTLEEAARPPDLARPAPSSTMPTPPAPRLNSTTTTIIRSPEKTTANSWTGSEGAPDRQRTGKPPGTEPRVARRRPEAGGKATMTLKGTPAPLPVP